MQLNLHLILICSAIFLLLTGWVWLLRNAFRTHVLWGFAGLFMPPTLILFGVLHLRGSRTALLTYVAGMIVLGFGLARPITVYLPTEPYPLPS